MRGLSAIARVARELREDVSAARDRDPAARAAGTAEILLTYPGVHAILAHRDLARAARGGRAARAAPALEREPHRDRHRDPSRRPASAATSSSTTAPGVVIGETAEIGDRVTLFQGVTLGGTGFAAGKRHPTVEDNVTIGSGAKLLGPITVGHGAKVGANSVVIHDVPPNATVVGNPGHPVRVEGRKPEGPDTDWLHLPDPVADALHGSGRAHRRARAAGRRPDRQRAQGAGARSARCGRGRARTRPAARARHG